ncbi:ROK family protein, partial [Acidimicrobiaceae bacterium USS-CC1]|nr:ROK family protein [Acidiferrimicrobium australe]
AAFAGRASTLVARAGGDPEAVRGEHVTAAAAAGEPEAEAILAELAWWLALGLANLANALDPEVMVVGGGLVDAGEVLMRPAREAFSRLVEAGGQRQVRIAPAALGARAGAVGAGLLALG